MDKKIHKKDYVGDIPKYKKKKESSTSKSLEKSKHKHEYTERCLVKYPTRYTGFDLGVATYCKHCGKIENIRHPKKEKTIENGLVRSVSAFMTKKEIIEYYRDLELVEISDIFQKYIPISKGDD